MPGQAAHVITPKEKLAFICRKSYNIKVRTQGPRLGLWDSILPLHHTENYNLTNRMSHLLSTSTNRKMERWWIELNCRRQLVLWSDFVVAPQQKSQNKNRGWLCVLCRRACQQPALPQLMKHAASDASLPCKPGDRLCDMTTIRLWNLFPPPTYQSISSDALQT